MDDDGRELSREEIAALVGIALADLEAEIQATVRAAILRAKGQVD